MTAGMRRRLITAEVNLIKYSTCKLVDDTKFYKPLTPPLKVFTATLGEMALQNVIRRNTQNASR